MTRAEEKIIENIIATRPRIYGWQESIEREQERVIADLVSPAKTVIKRLIELDNMRVDLCNLKVLYEFIKRGVGEDVDSIFDEPFGAPQTVYEKAKKQMELAGYTLERAKDEFDYLFVKLKQKRRARTRGVSAGAQSADFSGFSVVT